MITITKTKYFGMMPCITLDNGKIFLDIQFCANEDLYWTPKYSNNSKSIIGNEEFIIRKEDGVAYYIFKQLYDKVVNIDFDYSDINNDKTRNIIREESRQKDLIKLQKDTGLVESGTIKWISDDALDDTGNFVTISKREDAVILNFSAHDVHYFIHSDIRFRTSGSTYECFYIPFLIAYNKLLEIT